MAGRILAALLLLGTLAGCAPPVAGKLAPDPVGAYQEIVHWLYETDDGLNGHIFAIDPSGTGLPDPSLLVRALQDDPKYGSHEIIVATRGELKKQSLIVDKGLRFVDGFLVEFSAPSIKDGVVTVGASKWESGLGAIRAVLTARWVGHSWSVDRPSATTVA